MIKKTTEFDLLFYIYRRWLYPMHNVGELFVPGRNTRFCYTLEDTDRPEGQKIDEYTALAATGTTHAYDFATRHSPRFGRTFPGIFTHSDRLTATHGGKSFVGAMTHGGNDHTNTEGCPIVGYNVSTEKVSLLYRGKKIEWVEQVVHNSASNDLTKIVKSLEDQGKKLGLCIINDFKAA